MISGGEVRQINQAETEEALALACNQTAAGTSDPTDLLEEAVEDFPMSARERWMGFLVW